MATLKDLSRQLGLSVTQVSRALNGHSDVNEITRTKVMEAAKLLNYQPNLSARKLATGRSGTVGLVLPDPKHVAGDSLFVQMITRLSASFARRDIRFLLHICEDHDDPVAVHRRLLDSASLDGFVIIEPLVDDPRIEFLQSRGIPFVVHGHDGTHRDYASFDIDNYRVGFKLTEYLLSLGHRRIAFLNGIEGRSYCAERTRGYRDALAQAGIRFVPGLHRNGPMKASVGMVETIRMMQAPDTQPTAFIAGNTLLAKGIYQALAALEITVPGDISVVAHDDLLPEPDAVSMHPPLTVTESALNLSWEPLARLLSDALDGQPVDGLQEFTELTFIERRSAGPPKARDSDSPKPFEKNS